MNTKKDIRSISTNMSNVRQDVFPIDQWTITTRKGIIMQSKCTCRNSGRRITSNQSLSSTSEPCIDRQSFELCDICRYHDHLPQLHSMPDMLFNNNLMRLEHCSGVGVEFNALDALKLVEETRDPLRVAVADGWQSARADCQFAKSIAKPFDWTFTTSYRGTLLSAINNSRLKPMGRRFSRENKNSPLFYHGAPPDRTRDSIGGAGSSESGRHEGSRNNTHNLPFDTTMCTDDRLALRVEETDERIDVKKLKVREEILFYDDLTLYEDELADHGTAQYSVKVRVMPRSVFMLARYYLRVDGVLARVNDTRIYLELSERYILREYTNRESKLDILNLPVSTVINPSELVTHLPLIDSKYEKLNLPDGLVGCIYN